MAIAKARQSLSSKMLPNKNTWCQNSKCIQLHSFTTTYWTIDTIVLHAHLALCMPLRQRWGMGILAVNSMWDKVIKMVSYKHANVSDGWLQEMEEDVFRLVPLPKSKQKPSGFTDDNKDQDANMMRLKPEELVNNKQMQHTPPRETVQSDQSCLQTLLETTRMQFLKTHG